MKNPQDFWNERYKDDQYAYGIKANDFLAENVKHLKPVGKILCLSEGEGRNSVYLAKLGFKVEAVDFSSEAQRKALALAEINQVSIKYEVADLNDFNLGENDFDAVVSIFAHTNSSLRNKLFRDIKRSLKKDGVFLLEGYTKSQLLRNTGGPKDVDMFFSKNDLIEKFNDFSILHCLESTRDVVEGIYHNGEADVVQFIAKKRAL
jgi:cyclopropane fatty-acyl-phospholipid synthase-like methyltransferase